MVYQEAGVLYGCDDDKGNPHTADAWTGHWKRDIETRGIGVSVAKAAATVGGILLRFPPNVPGKFGHIVVSDGHGGTIEAMGKALGVRAARIAGRQWDAGILLPELSYDGLDTTAPDLPGPSRIFAIDAQNMNPLVIERIQRALKANGFDPGDVDGKFGPKMEAAVVAFQDAKGLVVDGDVGEETAESLGIGLAPITIEAAEARPAAAAPSAPDISVQRSLEPMGPSFQSHCNCCRGSSDSSPGTSRARFKTRSQRPSPTSPERPMRPPPGRRSTEIPPPRRSFGSSWRRSPPTRRTSEIRPSSRR